MATDRYEAARRGQHHKPATKHPYAAIEHRVIDSLAYADLTFSARSLLVLITRQLTKDNNGRLQATFSYMRRFGFDSERTLARAIAELIEHGFIYRCRAGGYQQGAALYAVTWQPIRQRDGLFLDGYKDCAWRGWNPQEKNHPPQKCRTPTVKMASWHRLHLPKMQEVAPAKIPNMNYYHVVAVKKPPQTRDCRLTTVSGSLATSPASRFMARTSSPPARLPSRFTRRTAPQPAPPPATRRRAYFTRRPA